MEEGGQHTLVGAVSWGIACGVVSIIAMDLYLEKLYKIYIFYRIAFLQFIAVCLPRGTGLTRLSKTMEEQNFAKHKFCIVELKNSVCFCHIGAELPKVPFKVLFWALLKVLILLLELYFALFFALFLVALFWALFCGFCLLFWALLIASTLFLI